MKKILVAFACVLALSACQTSKDIDTAIQRTLPETCKLAENAHASFLIVAAAGNVKQSTIDKEAAAWAGIQQFCADPSSVNSGNVLVKAATAYLAITQAMREAERSGA